MVNVACVSRAAGTIAHLARNVLRAAVRLNEKESLVLILGNTPILRIRYLHLEQESHHVSLVS